MEGASSEGAGLAGAGGFSKGWHVVERNSSSLFVNDSSLCNVEIRRLAPGSPPQKTCQAQASRLTLSKPQFISTVDGLESELKVTSLVYPDRSKLSSTAVTNIPTDSMPSRHFNDYVSPYLLRACVLSPLT